MSKKSLKYSFLLQREQLIENLVNFEGTTFRLSSNWNSLVPLDYKNKPIKYLEIGAYHGANVISVAESYGMHPDSKLYCIDP
jgi:hypothetical protein